MLGAVLSTCSADKSCSTISLWPPAGEVCIKPTSTTTTLKGLPGAEVTKRIKGGETCPGCPHFFCDQRLFGICLRRENVPGRFPYTAGVFPFRREGEDPTRMFAGEGDAFRTNARFKYVSEGMPAKRLSTAFDSVTLYGVDPDPRPDIYGKIGNAGVCMCASKAGVPVTELKHKRKDESVGINDGYHGAVSVCGLRTIPALVRMGTVRGFIWCLLS